MPKVKLSEKELRHVISTLMQEASPVAGATAKVDINFYDFISLAQLTETQKSELATLINAYGQFNPESDTAIDLNVLPFKQITIKDLKRELESNQGTLGFQTPVFPGEGSLEEKQQAVFDYLSLYLRLKIIDLLCDEKNTKNPRFVFFIDNAVYYRPNIDPNQTVAIVKIATKMGVGQNQHTFRSPAFFDKLGDKTFTDSIANPDKAADIQGLLASPYPGAVYISDEMATAFRKGIMPDAKKAVDSLTTFMKQFDNDFIETYFCMPVVYPDLWRRFTYDADHPLSTPWKQSYIIANIASQAASVQGGAAALYAKLMDFYAKGARFQVESAYGKDPFADSGLFNTRLTESKKILVSLAELKRIISMALLTEAPRGNPVAGADVPAEPGVFAKGYDWLRSLGRPATRKEAEDSAITLARRGIAAGKTTSEFLQNVYRAAPGLKSYIETMPINLDEPVIRAVLDKIIQPSGAGETVQEVKVKVVDILTKFVLARQAGRTPEQALIDVVGDSGFVSTFKGDLTKVTEWSPVLREESAKMLMQSASDAALQSDSAVKAFKDTSAVNANAGIANGVLEDALLDSVNGVASGNRVIIRPGVRFTENLDMIFNPDKGVIEFFISGSRRAALKLDSSTGEAVPWVLRPSTDPKDVEEIQQIFGVAGVNLLNNAVTYNTQMPAVREGKVLVDGASVSIEDVVAKSIIERLLNGASDALTSAMISPQKSVKIALNNELETAAANLDVGLTSLERLSIKTAGSEVGLGRFLPKGTSTGFGSIFPDRGRVAKFSRTIVQNGIINNLWIVQKIALGAPVRVTARAVRSIARDTSFIGRIADTVATSGFWSTLIGMAVWNGIRSIGQSETATQEESEFGIFDFLDSLIPDGPLNLGILNAVAEYSAAALDTALKGSPNFEALQALLEADPLAASAALGNALKFNYNEVDVSPTYFEGMVQKVEPDPQLVEQATAALERAGAAMKAAVARFNGNEQQAQDAVTAVTSATAALDAVYKTTGSQGTIGNQLWKTLETGRRNILDEVLALLSTSYDSLTAGESQSSVAGYKVLLVKPYETKSEASSINYFTYWFAMTAGWATGVDASLGDFSEINQWLQGAISGNTPSMQFGDKGIRVKGNVTKETYEKFNSELKKLGDKIGQLEKVAEEPPGKENAETPGAVVKPN